jgi:hypothetical protein
MAEIKNYTLNFGCGRTRSVLNFASAKLAFTEVERGIALRAAITQGLVSHG